MARSFADDDPEQAEENVAWAIKDIEGLVQSFKGSSYLEQYGALKFGEEVFFGYLQNYPHLEKNWIKGDYLQFRLLTDPSKKAVLDEKLALLKQAYAYL